MRAPLSWIREFTPLDAPVEALAAALNQLGLEVEALERPGEELGGVVVARVLDVVAHPDADKLTLVDLECGDAQRRVVCGASNVVPGMAVPYAAAGVTLPGGLRLERRKIRGVISDGMLCSAKELGLGDDHRGILELPSDSVAGSDVREVLGLDDVVFDLSITPNRPDAMCIVGVARELAAHFGAPLTVPEPVFGTDPSVDPQVTIRIDAPDRCPRYVGWVAQVTPGASPDWMQQRLVKAGMRPISNIVDVTNYVLLERNQPLHAFDLDRLTGGGVIVRTASEGEAMTTLDGVERRLTSEDLVICDAASVPQAIAGIMGGRDSEVSDATTSVLLEAAYFERMGIARSSKRLKLRSESSARFERGIDPERVAQHAARAMELLVEVAGARVAPEPLDEHPRPAPRLSIRCRTSKVNGLLGTSLTDSEVVAALAPLGLEVTGAGDDLVVVPPSFRPDLEREVDLVEEVARRIGFDAIGRTVPKPREQIGGLDRRQRERRLVADALVGTGFCEALTLPLISRADQALLGEQGDRIVCAANPLRAEESVLRTSLIPGLLRVAAHNAARGAGDVSIFEIGRVFLAPRGTEILPEEPFHVAAILTGSVSRRPIEPDRAVDPYDAVDAVRRILDALEIAVPRLVEASRPGFRPGRTAVIELDGEVAGVVGEVAAEVCESAGVSGPAVGFEIDLDVAFGARRRSRQFAPPSPYPPAAIDLAFVLDDRVAASDVVVTLQGAAEHLESVRVFDEFRSEAFGPGRRSLAVALVFRAPDRTLTDEEVGAARQRCIDAVVHRHGADLRA